MTAIKEARIEKIPIIALVDTDSDPSLVEYPIPSNDEAVSVLKFMLTKIEETIHPVKSRKTGAAKQQFNGVKKSHGKSTTSKKT